MSTSDTEHTYRTWRNLSEPVNIDLDELRRTVRQELEHEDRRLQGTVLGWISYNIMYRVRCGGPVVKL